MLKETHLKYRPVPKVDLPNRQWPDNEITKPPIWLSTDLRDGNQALPRPMDIKKKLRFFNLLANIGFKEIEIGYPSADQQDFDFARLLIEKKLIPHDVAIQVLAPSREDLIQRTFDSVKGAKQVILHIYLATAPAFRDTVLKLTKEEIAKKVVSNAELIKSLVKEHPETKWTLEYSPEAFSQTELPFALDVCNAVTEAWGATPGNKIILNLPATVEKCRPNVYADMIEWMHRNLAKRESVVLSVHPHNDRETGVAAAEFAVMAGADRVEGCLFGNGERTGNANIISLALNLHVNGICPNLDFSDMKKIVRVYKRCTGMTVHPRTPYAGDLVFTAFSGGHQDGIEKGLASWEEDKRKGNLGFWDVPYLLVDPKDLGCDYKSIIRVNSQSGKSGMASLLKFPIDRQLKVEFSKIVQRYAETTGKEVTADEVLKLFKQEFQPEEPIRYAAQRLCQSQKDQKQEIELTVELLGRQLKLRGKGNGPIDAAIHALGLPVSVQDYKEESLGRGSDARAISIVELAVEGKAGLFFGAGIHENTVSANMQAIISGINRAVKQGQLDLTPLEERGEARAKRSMTPIKDRGRVPAQAYGNG